MEIVELIDYAHYMKVGADQPNPTTTLFKAQNGLVGHSCRVNPFNEGNVWMIFWNAGDSSGVFTSHHELVKQSFERGYKIYHVTL